MLDDPAATKRGDPHNALGVAAAQSQQLLYSDYDLKLEKPARIDNVVLTGMGGSALAGLICRDWWDDQLGIPFVISRDYRLPKYVGKHTLVIASSYSGNTEETLSATDDAAQKGARIIAIAAGGKLQQLAQDNHYPFAQLPGGFQPRMAVWSAVRVLADVFDQLSLVNGAVEQLKATQPNLEAATDNLLPAVATEQNQAKQLAQQLNGKTPVIYAGPTLASAAYKWKISFNESAKNVAFCNVFSEFNHNEFMGWTAKPDDKPFAVVELQSDLDHPQIQKRFAVSNQLLGGKMPEPILIKAEGKSRIEQLLWSIQLGDFTSLYLALLNNVDPTPVELIEKLKQQLA